MRLSRVNVRRLYVAIAITILLVNVLMVAITVKPVFAAWWNYSWRYRRSITVDHTKVAGALSNFPVLVDVTIDTSKAQSDGDDFAFTDDAGSKLDHEIELYNSTSGHLLAWVRLLTLSSTVDTVFYMYYGNPSVSNQQNPSGVWDSNYSMVQHLEETSGIEYDSTANGNNGTPGGGLVQDASGQIDGADDFDGINDHVNITDSVSLSPSSQITISAWASVDRGILAAKRNTNPGTEYSWEMGIYRSSAYIRINANQYGAWSTTDLRSWMVYNLSDSTYFNDGHDVAVSPDGKYAYFLTFSSGYLSVVNITNIQNPSRLASTNAGIGASGCSGYNIVVSGSMAYIAAYNTTSGAGRIVAYNISNPLSPTLKGYLESTNYGAAHGIQVDPDDSNVVYMSCYLTDSIVSFNVSDPTNIVQLDILTDTTHLGTVHATKVRGNYLYATSGGAAASVNWFNIVDVSDPTNMFIRSSIQDSVALHDSRGVDVDGNYAYLGLANEGGTQGGLSIVNIADPDNPFVEGYVRTTQTYYTHNVHYVGGDRVVGCQFEPTDSVALFDVSNKSSPKVAGSVVDHGALDRAHDGDVFASGKYSAWACNGNLTIVENSKIDYQVTSQMVYIVATYNKDAGSNQMKIYVNGTLRGVNATYSSAISDTAVAVTLGRRIHTGAEEWYPGVLDEVRISNVARSAAWIATEYNNQLQPTTFYTLGPEETTDCSLTVNVVGNGSVAKVPDQPSYAWGTNVTLTANPDKFWSFDQWSGDASGTTNPITVNMTSNKTITATFTRGAATIHVPDDYPTISAAIAAAYAGDAIVVDPGTYNEEVVINKSVEVIGSGADSTFIDGTGVTLASPGLVKITAPGDVVFSGFTVRNAPGGPVDIFEILSQSSVAGVTYTVSHNEIYGTNDPDNANDWGFYSSNDKSNLIFTDNLVTQTGCNNIVLELHTGATEISNNTLDAGVWGTDAIFIMTYNGYDVTALQNVSYNIFDMGTGGPFDYDHRASAISFNTPGATWDLTDAKFTNLVIEGNTISNLESYRRGIGFWNGGGGGGGVIGPVVQNNTITGVTGATESYGIYFVGANATTNADILNNQIYDCDCGVYLRTTDCALGAQIYFNVISGNTVGLNNTVGTSDVDARYNYWGDPTGPYNAVSNPLGLGDPVTANVNYRPYLGGPWPECSLTVNVVGSGSVTKVPDQTTYTWGTNVTLTADSAVGWSFDHWSGDASGTDNPITINMTSDKTITATFTHRDLTVTGVTVLNNGCSLYANDTYVNGTLYYYPVEVKIKNVGTSAVGSFYVKLEVYWITGSIVEASQEISVTELAAGSTATINFTNLFQPTHFGLYRLTATVDSQENISESDETNNILTLENLHATVMGDINGDGNVNILDAVKISLAFTSTPSDGWWNIKADLNHDDKINVSDGARIGIHWGESS